MTHSDAAGVGHHLVIARLNDGVTLDEAMAAGDEAFTTMMTVKGGNGTIAAGESLDMTLDLEPGEYFVLDNPQLPDPVIETFTVSPPAGNAPEPESEGTIHIGPNMVIAVPDNFDGTGVWHFVNDDPALLHEAAMARLADGKTMDDVIAWGHAGFQGESAVRRRVRQHGSPRARGAGMDDARAARTGRVRADLLRPRRVGPAPPRQRHGRPVHGGGLIAWLASSSRPCRSRATAPARWQRWRSAVTLTPT